MENLLNLTGISYILSLAAFIALGICESFAGFKVIRGVVLGAGVLCGGAVGCAFGKAACQALLLKGSAATITVASVTVILALIASMLAFHFFKGGVFFLNGFVSYLIIYSICSLNGMPEPVSIAAGIIAAVLLGVTSVKLYRPYTIISSSLVGGLMVYLAALLIFKDRFGSIVNFIAGAVCALTGAAVQFVTTAPDTQKD